MEEQLQQAFASPFRPARLKIGWTARVRQVMMNPQRACTTGKQGLLSGELRLSLSGDPDDEEEDST